MSKQSNERLIATALHCNPMIELMGNVTGNTIAFGHKFVSVPFMTVAAIGGSTASVRIASKDKVDGYYVGATLIATDCDSVDWTAKGVAIKA
jgi:hypothetical protein